MTVQDRSASSAPAAPASGHCSENRYQRSDGTFDPDLDKDGRRVHFVTAATKEAADGWEELGRAATTNARRAYEQMRTAPGQDPDTRHHRLKGSLAHGRYRGRVLPRWQIEVTGSGRIWYLVDEESHTVWVQYASLKHPKETE